jgi:cytochrome c556
MADFKAEMQASREKSEKEMVAFRAEMQASRKRSEREMADFKAEMADFKDEMRADRRAMNKRWGEIANRLGTIVEDIVRCSRPWRWRKATSAI